MKKKKYSKLLLYLLCFYLLQAPAFAFEDTSIMNLIPIIPEAGTINTHDMENLRRMEIENQIKEDFQNYENQKKEIEQAENIEKANKKKKSKKAKIEEYATEGVYIENIEVTPSQILTEDEINHIIREHVQTNVTINEIKQIVKSINKLYAKKGYVTARAYLPPQTIENETIKIVLIEGKVGNVDISETKWTTKNYIKKRISLKQGNIFNVATLEQDLLNFNRYNDGIQLKGNLVKGSISETTDIKIQAEEKFPYSISLLVDNAGRESIGLYRAGVMFQAKSLTKHRDRFTAGVYRTRHSITPFLDYNIPINKKDGKIGVSYSYGSSDIKNGSYTMFNIENRSHNVSLYYNQPIIRKPWMELASISSIGYKTSTTSFDKADIYNNHIPYAQTGLSFRYDTKRGIWYANQNASFAFPWEDRDIKYLKLEGGILRLHDFGHGFVGQLRANYQVIPNQDNVPYADQMTAGGMNSVRGYTEGLLIGKDGYVVGAELQFPILPRTIKNRDKTKRIPFVGNYLKGFVFTEHAGIFPYKGTGPGSENINRDDFLISWGLGLKINLPKDIGIRIAWGFPMMRNSHYENQSWGRVHFDMYVTPDIDALLKLRHPKNKKPENIENVEKVENQDIKLAEDIRKNSRTIHKVRPFKEYIKMDNKSLAADIFYKAKPEIKLGNMKISSSDTTSTDNAEF